MGDLLGDAFAHLEQLGSAAPRRRRTPPAAAHSTSAADPANTQANASGPDPATDRARRTSLCRSHARPSGPDGRARPRRIDVDSLGSVLGREVDRRQWRYDLALADLENRWPQIVGEDVAGHASIQSVQDSTLVLTCTSTAWAANLRMMQTQLIATIAAKIGDDIITKLKIYGPTAPSWRKGRLHVKGRGPRDTYG
ncbi:MAG: DciA family protein [Corynebacterium sp.]|nr:DciA family protein [Corynebacterium sp.]